MKFFNIIISSISISHTSNIILEGRAAQFYPGFGGYHRPGYGYGYGHRRPGYGYGHHGHFGGFKYSSESFSSEEKYG